MAQAHDVACGWESTSWRTRPAPHAVTRRRPTCRPIDKPHMRCRRLPARARAPASRRRARSAAAGSQPGEPASAARSPQRRRRRRCRAGAPATPRPQPPPGHRREAAHRWSWQTSRVHLRRPASKQPALAGLFTLIRCLPLCPCRLVHAGGCSAGHRGKERTQCATRNAHAHAKRIMRRLPSLGPGQAALLATHGGGARRRAGPFTLSGCRQQRRERSHDLRDGRAARRARSHGHPTGAAPWGRLPPCRGPCPGRPAGGAGRPGPPASSRRASRSASAAACRACRAVPSPGSRARCRVTVSSQASAGCQAGASLCSGARSPTHTTPAACSGLLSWYGEGCWGSGRWSPSTARLFLCRPGSPCWLAKHTAAPNVVTQAVAAGRHACVRPPPGACASAAAVRAAPARLRTGEAQGRTPRRGHQQRMVGHVVQHAPGGRGQGRRAARARAAW